jgi:hypothetical protein
VDLTCFGTANVNYNVEASSDVTQQTWAELGTARTDAKGKLTFVDKDAPNYSVRFYRAVPVSQ